MNNIYILNENITNGFNIITLDIITIIAILCGVFVIVSKNPIVSVLFLIGLFLSISVYLMILGINFIGLSYLLVYVGAVSILFLFILMLINVRISEIVSTTSNSIPLGIIIGTLFFSAMHKALPLGNNLINTTYNNSTNYINLEQFGLNIIFTNIKNEIAKYMSSFLNLFKSVSKGSDNNNMSNISELTDHSIQTLHLTYSQNWDSMLAEVSHINTLGNILYTSFPL